MALCFLHLIRQAIMATYDYIVIGAGGSGGVLANQLSADPRKSVLLIERGGSNRFNPLIYIPKGFFFTLSNSKFTSIYMSKPFGPINFEEPWMRGRGLGGSTAINGMMYVRGYESAYKQLASLSSDRWGWSNFLRAFLSMENHSLGPSPMRGGSGPLGVTVPTKSSDETVDRIIAAAGLAGLPFVDDLNAQEGEQISYTPSTIKNGIRQSTVNRFINPIRNRKNLTIITDTHAGHLLFDGKRVVGVAANTNGTATEYRASREVILSAGAIETPLILERSGIGNGEVLKKAGVDLRVESPNVGERMIEQHGLYVQARFKREIGNTLQLSTFPKQMIHGAKYLVTRKGPVGTSAYDIMAHYKSSPDVEVPDVQSVIVPFALDFSEGMDPATWPGIYLLAYQIQPETTSSIHITDASPEAPPELTARYFETEKDRTVTSKAIEKLREILAQPPLADVIEEEVEPGNDVKTPEDALRWAQSPGMTIAHAVGSASMGNSADDVLDPDLRVREVEGLRVVDISVLPIQVSGNTASTAMALGWLAGEMIREQAD